MASAAIVHANKLIQRGPLMFDVFIVQFSWCKGLDAQLRNGNAAKAPAVPRLR
jgi:hypothetical protein